MCVCSVCLQVVLLNRLLAEQGFCTWFETQWCCSFSLILSWTPFRTVHWFPYFFFFFMVILLFFWTFSLNGSYYAICCYLKDNWIKLFSQNALQSKCDMVNQLLMWTVANIVLFSKIVSWMLMVWKIVLCSGILIMK